MVVHKGDGCSRCPSWVIPSGTPPPPSTSHVGASARFSGYAPRLTANKRAGAWPTGEV